MKKMFLTILSIICIILVSAAIFSIHLLKEKNINLDINAKSANTKIQQIKITYDNFNLLSKTEMIKALPDDAVLVLQFIKNNDIEKSYIVTKSKIEEINKEEISKLAPDLIITIPSSYLDNLTTANFCSIIQEAKNNGDLGIDLKASKTSLAWKYKSMFKYKSCLGL